MIPKISVLLCTYRPFPSIERNMSSLERQYKHFPDFELVLVGHGLSAYDIARGADGCFVRVPFDRTFIRCEKKDGKYRAIAPRVVGLEHCSGRLIFIMHDYTRLLGSDYLLRLWKASDEGTKVVATRKLVFEVEKRSQVDWRAGDLRVRKDVRMYDVTGFYCHQDAVPLDVLLRVGGFDKRFDGEHGYDDIDLRYRLEHAGHGISVVSDLVSEKVSMRRLFPLKNDTAAPKNLARLNNKWGQTSY